MLQECPRFYPRIFNSLDLIKNQEAIPTLLKLLENAKQPEFKQDIFNDLEERVLAALYNIGIQTNENYNAIKTALNSFIEKFTDKLPNVNFLFYTSVKIEEQLKIRYKTDYTIDTAIQEYNALFNS